MLSVKQQLKKLENLQNFVNKKLDHFEGVIIENNIDDFLNRDDSRNKRRKDLDIILNGCNESGFDKNRNFSDENLLKFYDHLASLSKGEGEPKVQKQFIKKKSIKIDNKKQEIKTTKIFKEMKIGTDDFEIEKKVILSFDNLQDEEIKINEENRLNKLKKSFMNNTLTELRIKLNKMKSNQNSIKSLIQNKDNINNYKFLDKIINGFIEKLAVNWNDIVELIINDLLEQEIYTLNEMEIEKINRNSLKLTTLADVFKNCPQSEEKINFNSDSLNEINDLLFKFKIEEDNIIIKYK